MRSLAAFFDRTLPDVAAVFEADAGNVLAFATRFDRAWAYRGRLALLWNRRIIAREVHDLYLPAAPLRPFDRRGLLRVDARAENEPLHLFATQFASDRSNVRELRYARSALRATGSGNALFFVARPVGGRVGFTDLGFAEPAAPGASSAIAARGYALEPIDAGEAEGLEGYSLMVARPSQLMPPPQTAGSQLASASND